MVCASPKNFDKFFEWNGPCDAREQFLEGTASTGGRNGTQRKCVDGTATSETPNEWGNGTGEEAEEPKVCTFGWVGKKFEFSKSDKIIKHFLS